MSNSETGGGDGNSSVSNEQFYNCPG